MRSPARMLLASALLIGCAQARSPVAIVEQARAPIVVVDGRQGWPEADVSAWKSSPAVLRAIDSARRHWSAEDPGYEEDVLVLATATGAFTRQGVEQRAVLYRMSLWPRGFPAKGLALLEAGQLVRNFAFAGLGEDLWALPDLDGDGRDELVFGGSFGMGGQMTAGVVLAAFGDEGLHELGNIEAYNDMCGAGDPERWGGPTASRVTRVPGSGMRIQRYSKPSCESETWEAVGDPEPYTLTPQGASFTEISRIPRRR